MTNASVQRSDTGSGAALGALLVALAAVAFSLFSADEASAQFLPDPRANTYCAEVGPQGRRPINPVTYLTVTPIPSGAGTVTAARHGPGENCVRTSPPVCPPSCQFQVITYCEFHCQHDHTAPFPSDVLLTPANGTGYFLGWTAECLPRVDAPQNGCVVNMNQDKTATAHFGTTDDTQAPTQPSLTATGGAYAATLSWTPSSDPWLAGYDIYRNNTPVARVDRNTTTYRAQSLFCETAYTFRVEAFDARNRTASNDASATTTACGPPPVPDTVLHVKPPRRTKARTAFFHWGVRGTIPATRYQCKLDRGRWVACSARSGKRYRRLKPGYHTFLVRAGNAGGFDRAPARWRWFIRR